MSNMFLDYDGPILRRIEHLNTFASPYRLTLHKGAGYLYWEHPDGRRALRTTWLPDEGARVVGFNFMGLRARHRVCERWIAERRTLASVLAELPEVGFDPEFSRRFEREAARHMASATR